MIKVLVVEDDPMVAELNKNYLKRIGGFDLTGTLYNGQDALDFINTHPVSLLLLDVFMPGLDGLSLLKKVRHRHPGMDVIMITAARSSNDIQAALKLGVIDYIVKPFEFERFQLAMLNYQERVRLLSGETELNQTAIDSRIFAKEIKISRIPKGIENETLQRIRSVVKQFQHPFSVQDLVPVMFLSRISLKKYLDYLVETGELNSELSYRGQGRPVRLYRSIE